MIRYADINDAILIQKLVNNYANAGQMLHISLNEVYEKIFEFALYIDDDNKILGICALHPTWGDLAEIRSLAVEEKLKGMGIGRSLVMFCLERARKMGFQKVFSLTYQAGFFEKCGFVKTDIDNLPKKIWTDCLKCPKYPNCDETAVEIVL